VPGLDAIASLDRDLLGAVTALRTGPLTTLMLLASAWWVKGLVIGGMGVAADLIRRPRSWPVTLLPVAAALLAASALSAVLKEVADRARPSVADTAMTTLTALPADASFPSGHALSAFAAAGVVTVLHPRLRVPALALAALVGVSRVYLGVHYPLDVLAGAALGLAVSAVVLVVARRAGLIGAGPLLVRQRGAPRWQRG
jgi:undecaprenyl-diphosphatase